MNKFNVKIIKHSYSDLTLRKGEGIRSHKSFSQANLETTGLALLEDIRKGKHQAKDVYKRIMLSPEVIEVAYRKISKNKPAMTPGIDGKTLDGISRKRLDQILLQLKNHTFQFKPAGREYIPKANGKLRPLGQRPIATDKIVQQAMAMIFEAVFEKFFLQSSHAFRRHKGCHTALKQISRWNAIDWFIQGDLKSYDHTIDHDILKDLIFDKIPNQQFIELYWKAVRAGYVEFNSGKKIHATIGTAQGSLVSPVLKNIYLHQFDLYMEKLCRSSLVSGKTSKPFQPYLKQHSRIHTLYKKNLCAIESQTKAMHARSELQQTIKKTRYTGSRIQGHAYGIYYVRYADDFLVGINGNLNKATEIKQNIGILLEKTLKLTTSEEKTKLINSKDKAFFLATEIYRPSSGTNDQKSIRKYNAINKTLFRTRTPAAKLVLNIPIMQIVQRLQNQGICKVDDWQQGKIIPTAKTAWMNHDLKTIIEKYNNILLGYRNYYSFSNNFARMQVIQFILQHSCAKTIMRKNKLHSRSQVFKKYGFNIKVKFNQDKSICLQLLPGHKPTGKFLINGSNAA